MKGLEIQLSDEGGTYFILRTVGELYRVTKYYNRLRLYEVGKQIRANKANARGKGADASHDACASHGCLL